MDPFEHDDDGDEVFMPHAGPSRARHRDVGPVKETYRHLLSPTALTPSNPFRVIAHCDVDAAYAQFEAARIGSPDDQPLIVIQWETIIAVKSISYPARKYGITRCAGMGPKEALELCPHLTVVHTATFRPGEMESGYWDDANVLTHKVSLDPYRRESAKIMKIFQEMTPNCSVEKASIDEAYIDFTPAVIQELLRRFPFLGSVPPDAPDGIDSVLPPAPPVVWSDADNLLPDDKDAGPSSPTLSHRSWDADDREEVEIPNSSPTALQEFGGMMRRSDTPWRDWALCIGSEIMNEVRKEIWVRLHYTTSAGIAHNKAMAKLSSSQRKPNGQTILRHSAVRRFLAGKNFTDIRNLGGKLGRAIAETYGSEAVEELLKVPLPAMQAKFGDEVIWVYNLIRGIDETALSQRVLPKSMLASKNVLPAITHSSHGDPIIKLLAGELALRLREAREISPHLWAKTLVLSWRIGFGYGVNNVRSKQCGFPRLKVPEVMDEKGRIKSGEELEALQHQMLETLIAKLGQRMWGVAARGIWKKKTNSISDKIQITTLAMQFTGVQRQEEGQKGIDSFLNFADSGIVKGVSPTPPPAVPDPPKDAQPEGHMLGKEEEEERTLVNPVTSELKLWTCPRCQERLEVLQDAEEAFADVQLHLDRRRQEHEDFHAALDLHASFAGPDSVVELPVKRQKTVRSQQKISQPRRPEDIRAFFSKS